MANEADVFYTLHYFPFSLYSLMIRFGLSLGQQVNPKTAPKIEIKLVNLHREEHLSETFLTSINPKGQVPVLTSPTLSSPLHESYDISKWLCERQPELIPAEHREVILQLMDKLYKFHAMALTVALEDRKDGIPNQAAAFLENQNLSETHRRALEIKSIFHDTTYSRTLEPESIQLVEEQACNFFQSLEELLGKFNHGETWIFGGNPTILDAHATVLAARLVDLERYDIVSNRMRDYAHGVMSTKEWFKATQGRRTIWDISVGHVSNLDPL